MKTSFLVRALLLGISVSAPNFIADSAWAAPAINTSPKSSPMPAEVRAMMAKGATTVGFVPLNLGMKNTQVLLHCWTIERSSDLTASGEHASVLFCLDLFLRDSDNDNKWQLSSSTSYQGGGHVREYQTRWLLPAIKQGLVIVETSEESTDVLYRLITFPDWQGITPGTSRTTRSNVHEFFADFGGPSSSSVAFGVDKKRGMTVEEVIAPHADVLPTKNIYAWNGDGWAIVSSRPDRPGNER